MLYTEIQSSIEEQNAPAVIRRGDQWSYRDLYECASGWAAALADLSGGRVATYLRDGPELIALLLALDALGTQTYLISGDSPEAAADALLNEFEIPAALVRRLDVKGPNFVHLKEARQSASVEIRGGGEVIIFTSGTTSKPKAARHTWHSLAAGIKRDSKFRGSRWLLTYGLTRFAGLQVFLQTFLNRGTLVVPETTEVGETVSLIIDEQVEYVSGTPTFWRKLLAASTKEQHAKMRLKQVTLGGEIVTQPVLSALRSAFPTAQITHIYASTEMGVCFSVHDGLEGFPAALLQQESAGVLRFRIEDGELMIRSERGMSGYVGRHCAAEEWFPSGDLVEVRGNRAFFLGRRSEIINVGGSKVYPAEIEENLRTVPGVLNARVFAQKSSIAGQLVGAEVVADPIFSPAEVRAAIMKRCSENLAPYKHPRLIRFVGRIEETDSQKILRAEAENK